MRRRPAHLVLWFTIVLCAGCASIPKRQYGVNTLKIEGMEELDPEALRACLATRQRKKLELGLGALSKRECGKPPFDEPRRAWRLFAWPWSDWPVYDEAVLKLDLERMERWYRARGYYGARIADVTYEPEAVEGTDRRPEDQEDEGVDITVTIDEGEPVRVRKLELEGVEGLDPELREELEEALTLTKDAVFDEGEYDVMREELVRLLREAGHARAVVDGEVVIHKSGLAADVRILAKPGPVCRIGDVRVVSKGKVPIEPIRAAALLVKGSVYQESDLEDAQRSVYALGAFSSVTVHGDLEKPGEVIDVIVEVEPRRESEVALGLGLMSGVLATGPTVDDTISVPQWDVHLLGSYENRNFFGKLRRFRIEDRPRMLFLAPFPGVPDNSPRFGNVLTANFSQPGVIEPRTTVFTEARWDTGPDPFQLFFRHDVGVSVGLERGFFRQRLIARVAIHQEFMQVYRRQPILDEENEDIEQQRAEAMCPEGQVTDDCPDLIDIPSSYRLPFLEQRITLDLRDDAVNPSKGGYFRLAVQEAARLWDPSWNYVRVAPEARGYAPLGLGMVLAARFAIASLHIFSAADSLDDESFALGPQAYRLRGGGAQSNRGFAPGELGTGFEDNPRSGGIRRWEGSLEWRIPLAESFGLVLFGDVGDVNAKPNFRFDHLNLALGAGLRYRTIIGPIRFDVAGRPSWGQHLDGSEPSDATMNLGFTKFRGAVHLTIGEAF